MKSILSFLFIVLCSTSVLWGADRPRLVVTTDIGGDPDDQQALVRLLVHADQFDIEGLIASACGTPGDSIPDTIRTDLIRQQVRAYGAVRGSLLRHSGSFPSSEALLEVIKAGNPHRGVENIGPNHDTEGSNHIIALVDRNDPRPVNITIWGGSTELAQALWRVRNDRPPLECAMFYSKIRVHAIGHQDDTGPWILENFPELFYILSKADDKVDHRNSVYRGMYMGGDESLTSQEWIRTHVVTGHGPLGALYPTKTWTAPNPHSALKEGDTPSWFYFLPNGLSDPEHPEWGGWGGRFVRIRGQLYQDAQDTVDGKTGPRETVSRWRKEYQGHFQARMDWCVKDFDEANHQPVVNLADAQANAITPGREVRLDASASTDPDGDALRFEWMFYREASECTMQPVIRNPESPVAVFVAPNTVGSETFHVILKVTDSGEPPLTSYARVVLTVKAQ